MAIACGLFNVVVLLPCAHRIEMLQSSSKLLHIRYFALHSMIHQIRLDLKVVFMSDPLVE